MELRLTGSRAIPEGSVVSVRFGRKRRLVMSGSDKPLRFDLDPTGPDLMKVDVYAPIAHARLLVEPGKGTCSVNLDGATGEEMGLDFSVEPCSEDMVESAANVDECLGLEEPRPPARHRVAVDAQPYFEEHRVLEVVQALLQGAIADKPPDPYAYMVKVLENTSRAANTMPRPPRPPASELPPGGPAPVEALMQAIPEGLRIGVLGSTLLLTQAHAGSLSRSPAGLAERSAATWL